MKTLPLIPWLLYKQDATEMQLVFVCDEAILEIEANVQADLQFGFEKGVPVPVSCKFSLISLQRAQNVPKRHKLL